MNIQREMLTKKILHSLSVMGAMSIAATSPYFGLHLSRNISQAPRGYLRAIKKAKLDNAFFYMKRKGYIRIEEKNHQIYISLTAEGRKRAGKYMIDELNIKKPKKWDGKWRVVVFDIPNATRIIRDALRGKLIELGFYKIQQSIWVFPYECQKEIALLREFFGLKAAQLQLIRAEKIEDEYKLKKIFRL